MLLGDVERLRGPIDPALFTRMSIRPNSARVCSTMRYVAEALQNPPVTRNQVELMRQDNILRTGCSGF